MHTMMDAGKTATRDARSRDGNHAGYFPAAPYNRRDVTTRRLRPRPARGCWESGDPYDTRCRLLALSPDQTASMAHRAASFTTNGTSTPFRRSGGEVDAGVGSGGEVDAGVGSGGEVDAGVGSGGEVDAGMGRAGR